MSMAMKARVFGGKDGWMGSEPTASKLLSCPTCSHEHLRADGAYVECPVCVFDPIKDPRLQGCWITVPG